MSPGAKVFIAYAREDAELHKRLCQHLRILERAKVIRLWHDQCISPGAEWASEIGHALQEAQLILLLGSADFIAYEYCYGVEVKEAMRRHEAGSAKVIPVILRAVRWTEAPFGKLQALPRNARPVTSWPDVDMAFQDVVDGVAAEAEKLIGQAVRTGLSMLPGDGRLSWR